MRRLIPSAVAVLALATVGAAGALASPLAAAPGTLSATTHTSQHPDTCVCVTSVSSPNGYVWAYDNLSRKLSVTANTDGSYTVTVTDDGSFAAFAEPNPTDPTVLSPTISANGSIHGTITFVVTGATQGPDPSLLPAQMPSDTSTSATVLTLFGGTGTLSGGDYTYTYRAGGETYTQTTSSITGDITGH